MKTQILNQILFDIPVERRDNNIESLLLELEQAPENIINSLFDKSYDEMTNKEREEAIKEITDYIL